VDFGANKLYKFIGGAQCVIKFFFFFNRNAVTVVLHITIRYNNNISSCVILKNGAPGPRLNAIWMASAENVTAKIVRGAAWRGRKAELARG